MDNIIKRENLTLIEDTVYQTTIEINGKNVEINLDPDDVDIEETIQLANKIMSNFEFYETKAKQIIVEEYLDTYNDNWREDEDPILDKEAFSKNITFDGAYFLGDSSVDFWYTENGMFGNHTLVAESFDGENFDDTSMDG